MTAERMPAWGDEVAAAKEADWAAHCEGEERRLAGGMCRCEHLQADHEGGTGGCDRLGHPLCGCLRYRPNTRGGTCVICAAATSDANDLCVRCENEERHLAERRTL